MSYYAAIILKDLLVVVNDRCRFNEFESKQLENKNPRIVPINPSIFFIPSGDLVFGVCLGAVFKVKFKNPIDLEAFKKWKTFFQERASGLYGEISKMNLESLKMENYEYQNFDGLLVGISSEGNLFIISLSSSNNFAPEILTKPFSYLMLNQEPEVLQKVKEIIEKFLVLAKTTSTDLIKGLAKEKLPGIIRAVSEVDRYCTPYGDILFLNKKGEHEIFSFDKG